MPSEIQPPKSSNLVGGVGQQMHGGHLWNASYSDAPYELAPGVSPKLTSFQAVARPSIINHLRRHPVRPRTSPMSKKRCQTLFWSPARRGAYEWKTSEFIASSTLAFLKNRAVRRIPFLRAFRPSSPISLRKSSSFSFAPPRKFYRRRNFGPCRCYPDRLPRSAGNRASSEFLAYRLFFASGRLISHSFWLFG